MRNQVTPMASLEVILKRLPEAVIAGLEGPVVKQDLASLQSLPALDMSTVAMLLRRKVSIHSEMPLMEVVLERLPESVITSFMAKRRGCTMMPLSDIKTPKPLPKLEVPLKQAMPLLEVTLERLPEDTMTMFLSQQKVMSMAVKQKKKIGHLKKTSKSPKSSLSLYN